MYGISIGRFIEGSNGWEHIFDPKQEIIKPNINGKYRIFNPKNPNESFIYP